MSNLVKLDNVEIHDNNSYLSPDQINLRLHLGEMHNQKKAVTYGSNASAEDTQFPYVQRKVGDSLSTDDLIDVGSPTESTLATK